VHTGYRGQFYYKGENWDADQEYLGRDCVRPGDTARTLFRFLSPHAHVDHLEVGTEFEIREGVRVIARGTVIRILHLKENARRTMES
jgi:translation elongation factor EF-Tu-like GTPase